MASVQIDTVTKTYPGGVRALSRVSLEIPDRRFTVLVGPSGCGKSTLLRMIAGLEPVTEGRITIGNRFVNHVPARDRNVAMVFQNYALYPHMSVFDNMAFGLRMRGVPRAQQEQQVKAAAEILGLSSLLDRKPRQLSGGQAQRVAVGRAIVRQPEVFLFDEPLSNLDAQHRTGMRRELAELHRRLQTTIILVTHDQIEAMTLGEQIVVLNTGEVQQVGDPQTVYDRPANQFVAGFVGTPAMNFLPARLVRDSSGVQVRVGEMWWRIAPDLVSARPLADDSPVTVGIRPEALSLLPDAGATNRPHWNALVDEVQHLGNEQLVFFRFCGVNCVARLEAHIPMARGETHTFSLETDRLHVFDSSGQNIRAG